MSSDKQSILINEHEAARLLSLSLSTLRKWRASGEGPAWLKLGASVRYRRQDIADYCEKEVRA
jgi:excisionase family DNA binding protein